MINTTKNQLARLIDHTLLKPESTPEDIVNLCAEAREFGFATVCVNPCHVSLAAGELAGSGVGVCSVVGFPLGANDSSIKAAEAAAVVQSGASEVDMVMNIGLLKGGMHMKVLQDIEGVVRAVHEVRPGIIVKVILETCLLSDFEKIAACQLSVEAGADFVKTSTGFSKGGATALDVHLLRRTVGPGTGVKASGGIRDLARAISMLESGADRLGTSSGISIMKEQTLLC